MALKKLAHWQFVAAASLSAMLSLAAPAAAQRSKDITVTTKDGVTLGATYFASDAGKEAAPVIILPDFKDSRAAFTPLAQSLQRPSGDPDRPAFAVLTVDLRGHGESTKQRFPNGSENELDASKLRIEDFRAMVVLDMEAVRRFLVTENDSEKLNLNKLTIIGTGLGASVGTLWAAQDWSAPPLAVGKQGQDVKALVMISPRWKSHGLLMQTALRQRGVQRLVAMMIMFGMEDSAVRRDISRIKGQVERFHPEPESTADKPSDLQVLAVPDTRLQGGELLRHVGEPADKRIADFLYTHVVDAPHEWSQRRNRIP
jgi:pimeloyl-ACP methyl ester carboxylesterase